MTLTLLLVLAGSMANESPGVARPAGPDSGVSLAAVERQTQPSAFWVAPLQLGPSARPLALRPGETGLAAQELNRGTTQLRNPKTAVTCTMRVVVLQPPIDPGILRPTQGSLQQLDPIVRNQLSPCLE